MSAAVASEDCDFEASIEELVEDGWAKIASGLRVSPGSALEKVGQVMESVLAPAKATLVMLVIEGR